MKKVIFFLLCLLMVTVSGRAQVNTSWYTDNPSATTFTITANEQPGEPRIYSRNGQLIVETVTPTSLVVYAVTGQQVANRRLSEGTAAIPLPKGIYIVRLDKRTVKMMVND